MLPYSGKEIHWASSFYSKAPLSFTVIPAQPPRNMQNRMGWNLYHLMQLLSHSLSILSLPKQQYSWHSKSKAIMKNGAACFDQLLRYFSFNFVCRQVLFRLQNGISNCQISISKQKKTSQIRSFRASTMFFIGGWVEGFEPSVFGTTIRRFNQLSYTHHIQFINRRKALRIRRRRALKDSNL